MGVFEKLFRYFPDIFFHKKKILSILQKTATPVFLADRCILSDRYDRLERALQDNWKNHQIAYSFKTNYDIARSRIFQSQGSWAEVVSGKEYALAKKLGYAGHQIIFNGPYKTEDQLGQAFRDDALVHIDHKEEMEKVIALSKAIKHRIRVGVRISMPIPHVARSRFGFFVETGEALAAIQKLKKTQNVDIKSVHAHIGTDIDTAASYAEAVSYMADFADTIMKETKKAITFLDIGGGFPSHGEKPFSRISWHPKRIEDYVQEIVGELKRHLVFKNIHLVVEPGRCLVDDGIIFVCRVMSVRRELGKQIILTDATLTMLPLKWYRPQIIRVYSQHLDEKSGQEAKTVLYGASCREDDLIFEGQLSSVVSGDYVTFFCVGAYNQSMASDFIFKKPATVFL